MKITIKGSAAAGAILVGALSISGASAQSGGWVSVGPDGGGIPALAINPSTTSQLFGGSLYAGIFGTSNSANSWTLAGGGAPVTSGIKSIDFSRSIPTTVYAAGSGVWVSTDGGSTWTARGQNLKASNGNALDFTAVSVDPTSSHVVYVGTALGGIFKSTDGGTSWKPANNGIPPSVPPGIYDNVDALLVDPDSPATVYAGFDQTGLFASTDGGGSWKNLPEISPSGSVSIRLNPQGSTTEAQITAIAKCVNPNVSDKSIAVIEGFGGDLYGLKDPGDNAPSKNPLPPVGSPGRSAIGCGGSPTIWKSVPNALAAPDGTEIFLADDIYGVFKTADNGAHWTKLSAGLPSGPQHSFLRVAVDSDHPSLVYLGTGTDGVFKSTDDGASWASSSSGIHASTIQRVAFDPAMPAILYSADISSGISRSTDGGQSWKAADQGLTDLDARTVVVDPHNPGRLFATTTFHVNRSTDSAGSWAPAEAGLGNIGGLGAIATDPANPNVVYVDKQFVGLYRSTDGGLTWAPLGTGLPQDTVASLVVDPLNPAKLWAGTRSNGLFKSTDSGAHWAKTAGGDSFLEFADVESIIVDPTNSSDVYVADGNGVAKSVDGGAHFTDVNDGLTDPDTFLTANVVSLAINPASPQELYAAINGGTFTPSLEGIFHTTDGGAHWQPLAPQLPAYFFTSLTFVPGSPPYLYAATSGAGVFRLAIVAPPQPRRVTGIGEGSISVVHKRP